MRPGGRRLIVRAALVATLAFAIASGPACRRRDDHAPPAPGAPAADPAAKALAQAARQEAACDVLVAAVADGTWVGTSGGAHRFVARCGRDPDVRAASRELQSFFLAAQPDCPPTVDVGGGPGVEFYDLLAAMDAARMAGFGNIGMSGASDLVAMFPAAPGAGDRAPPDCAAAALTVDARPSGEPIALEPPVFSGRALSGNDRTVVVSIDAETISVNGKAAAAVAASSLGLIPDLARALPPPADDLIVVVTGDRHVDAAIVLRVVRTLSASGHKDVRFALAPR